MPRTSQASRPYTRINSADAQHLVILRGVLKFEESHIELCFDGQRYRLARAGTTVFVALTQVGPVCDTCPISGASCLHELAVNLLAHGTFQEPPESYDLEDH